MGCIARAGCLIVLLVLGVAAWFTRGYWLPRVTGRPTVAATSVVWEPLTDAGAQRTRTALARLEEPAGPVFTTLSGGDVASYVFKALAAQLPGSADSVQAAVIGNQMWLRAVIKPSEVGGGALTAFGALLKERERVELAGTIRILRPGLAEFGVQSIRLGNLSLPQAMIPRALTTIFKSRRAPVEGVSERGVPLTVPPFIGDVRIDQGRITLYRTTR